MECIGLKPDWFSVKVLFCSMKPKQLFMNKFLKNFHAGWNNRNRPIVIIHILTDNEVTSVRLFPEGL